MRVTKERNIQDLLNQKGAPLCEDTVAYQHHPNNEEQFCHSTTSLLCCWPNQIFPILISWFIEITSPNVSSITAIFLVFADKIAFSLVSCTGVFTNIDWFHKLINWCRHTYKLVRHNLKTEKTDLFRRRRLHTSRHWRPSHNFSDFSSTTDSFQELPFADWPPWVSPSIHHITISFWYFCQII